MGICSGVNIKKPYISTAKIQKYEKTLDESTDTELATFWDILKKAVMAAVFLHG